MPPRDSHLEPISDSPHIGSEAIAQSLQIVKQHLRQLDRPEPSPERSVHQLRVATRRASAALDLFSESLRPKEHRRWQRRLKIIRKTAGHARDLDVLIQRQSHQEGTPKSLLRNLRKRRRQAQKALNRCRRRWAPGSKWQRQFKRLKNQLRQRATQQPQPANVRKTPHEFLQQTLDRFKKRGQTSIRSLDDLHAFRIQAKQLRYSIQWATPELAARPTAQTLKQLRRIQNRLGTINDHAVAIERLSREKKVPKKLVRQEKKQLEQAFIAWTRYWSRKRQTKFQRLAQQLVKPPRPPKPEPFDISLKFR